MSLKKDGIMYVKACVIANGIPDKNDDVLNKKEIKQIYSNSLKIRCDVNHDFVEREGVDILETTITNSDEFIKDVTIPAGSWMVIIRILDKDIQELILNGELNGVSITAVPDVAEHHSLAGGTMTYKDVKNFDKINPLFISLVGMPCNNLPWEVMNHVQYISKSYVEDENILDDDKIVLSTENFVGILKQLVPTKRKPTQAELTEPVAGNSEDKIEGDVDNMVDTTTPNDNGNDDLQKVLAGIIERLDKLEQASVKPEEKPAEPVEAIEKAEPVQDLEPQFAKLESDLKTYIKDLLDSYVKSGETDASEKAKPKQDEKEKPAESKPTDEEATSEKASTEENGNVSASSEKKPEEEEKPTIKKGVHSQKVEFIQKGNEGTKIKSFAEMTGRDPVTFRKL